jgi:hypothetical protein
MERRYSYSGFAAQVYLKQLHYGAGKLGLWDFNTGATRGLFFDVP